LGVGFGAVTEPVTHGKVGGVTEAQPLLDRAETALHGVCSQKSGEGGGESRRGQIRGFVNSAPSNPSGAGHPEEIRTYETRSNDRSEND
jgi:hypothetical protein